MSNIIWKIKRIFKKIKNIIRWIPVIWNDEDWDFSHLLDILHFKLENMQKYFQSSNYIDDSEKNKIVDELTAALHYLEEIIDDKCEMDIMQEYYDLYTEYPKISLIYTDGMYKLKELSDEQAKIFKEYNQKAFLSKKHNKNMFFKILMENYEGWWD